MGVGLPRTETALSDCRAHLDVFKSSNPMVDVGAVESYLTRHVLSVLCAEVESLVLSFVDERIGAAICDLPVATLLTSIRRGDPRSARHKDVGDTVGRFGLSYRARYEAAAERLIGDEGIQRIGSAVAARNDNAHASPSSMTFAELEIAVGFAGGLLEAVRVGLELSV